MEDQDQMKSKIQYFQTLDIWKQMAHHHNTLYNMTCQEYEALLNSNLEEVEKIINDKQVLIEKIRTLESARNLLIDQINESHEIELAKASDLIDLFEVFDQESNLFPLAKFNEFLVDIIEKIQEQNKANKLFINKALANIEELTGLVSPKESLQVYNAKGSKKVKSLNT